METSSPLESLLSQKERERKEVVAELACIFCKHVLKDSRRTALFEHFWETHHFHVGHPDNLVYLDDFVEMLRTRLHEEHKCLHCDKVFDDYSHVRLHMRKKKHLQISERKEYDRFYLSNYVRTKVEGEEQEDDDDDEDDDEDDDDEDDQKWDWEDDNSLSGVECLLCPAKSPSTDMCLNHMRLKHGLDLLALVKEMRLDFFSRIKLINYVRRRVAAEGEAFDWNTLAREQFLDVQYLFPSKDDDELLTHEFAYDISDDDEEDNKPRRLSI